MALLIADNFDHYSAVSQMTDRRWTSAAGTFDTGRGGSGNSFHCNSNTDYFEINDLSAYTGRVYASFWFKYASNSTFSLGLKGSSVCRFWKTSSGYSGLALLITYEGQLVWNTHAGGNIAWSQVRIPRDTWTHIQLCGRLSESISANDVRCVINGFLDPDMTLAATTDTGYSTGYENIDAILFAKSTYWNFHYDEVIVWDDSGSGNFSDGFLGSPHSIKMGHIHPNGNGNTSDFTGSDADSVDNYLHVDDDTPDDDTSYIESNTQNDIDLHAYPDCPTVTTIHGVQVVTRAKKTDTDSRGIKPLTRVNGSNYEGSEVTLTNGTYEWSDEMWEDNPDDAAAWEEADVDGAEFGVKVST